MNVERPTVLILAGPNGAGKSTLAPVFLRDTLSIRDYVNADTIAHGLSAFASEEQAFRAGRIMLTRLRDFADDGRSSRLKARWRLVLMLPGSGAWWQIDTRSMLPSSGCGRPTWLSRESRLGSGPVDTPWRRMSFVGDMPVESATS